MRPSGSAAPALRVVVASMGLLGLASLASLASASMSACSSATNDATSDGGVAGVDATTDARGAAGGPSDLPCDVASIVTDKCNFCHAAPPVFGAPMPLVTRADFLAAPRSAGAATVWESVKDRVHRPDGAPGRMPQRPSPALSASELATLDAWFDAGLPPSSAACGAGDADGGASGVDAASPPQGTPGRLSCKTDLRLRAKTPWTMPKDTEDEYVCFGIDVPVDKKRHVVGIAPAIANPKIVHHVLLMQADKTVDATPHVCSETTISRYRFLYGWAPGVGAFEMPPEAGLPAEAPTAHFVVQVHYNNVQGLANESDASGFDLCSTEELRPNDADVAAFGSLNFTIPARTKRTILSTLRIPALFTKPMHVIGAFPHMHGLGRSIVTELFPKDAPPGSPPIDLGRDDAFDFNNQFFAEVGRGKDIQIKAGDTVKTRCAWENTTSKDVSYGEYTSDEMCYSFTMYYPKIVSPQWQWGLPAGISTTTVEP